MTVQLHPRGGARGGDNALSIALSRRGQEGEAAWEMWNGHEEDRWAQCIAGDFYNTVHTYACFLDGH